MLITIPGNPVAKSRPRFFRRGNFVSTYDDQASLMKKIKQDLIDLGEKFSQNHKSYHVLVKFYLKPHGKDINEKLWGFSPCTQKNDIDNICKTIFDCGNGILWEDDSQIVSLIATKEYSNNPRTEIEIMPIESKVHPEDQKVLSVFSPAELEEFSHDAECIELNRIHEIDDKANLANCLRIFASKWNKQIAKIKKLAER